MRHGVMQDLISGVGIYKMRVVFAVMFIKLLRYLYGDYVKYPLFCLSVRLIHQGPIFLYKIYIAY